MRSITRRRLIAGGVAAIAAKAAKAIVPQTSQSPPDMIPGVPECITLIQPGSAYFESALNFLFPSYAADPIAKAMLPATAIIRNGGRARVKAYSFRWVTPGANQTAEVAVYSRLFVSRPSTKHLSVIGTGRNTLLRPGHYAIVTPLFAWSASAYRSRKGLIPPNIMLRDRPEAAAFISTLSSAHQYRLRRNVKICKKIALGDANSVIEYETARNAERDVALVLINGASGGELVDRDALDALLRHLWPTSLGEVNDPASVAARRYIKSLRAKLQLMPLSRVQAEISLVAARQITNLSCRARQMLNCHT
jgi:hypothetical protein